MHPTKEPDLQQLYSEQRAADQQRTPSFARTWQAAADRKHVPFTWWPVLVPATAALTLVLLATVWLRQEPDTSPAPQTANPPGMVVARAEISEWMSPTAALLDTFLETAPAN